MAVVESALPSDRQTVLLVGMHRSGTSVLTRLINLMGAYVGEPEELIGANQANPTGHWERKDLGAAHENFLRENGYGWSRVAGFDFARIAAESTEKCRSMIHEIVAGIDSANRPLLIKDPRLCLLLPLWQSSVELPYYVVAVRDPLKIARSLNTAFPNAFTTHFLLALWEKYMQCALRALYDKPVLFLSYSHMLEDPEGQSVRLSHGLRDLGVRSIEPVSMPELRSVLDPKLNRSGGSTVEPLSAAQTELYEWLVSRCSVRGPVTFADFPQSASPDATLRELELVRSTSIQWGVQMAKRQLRSTAVK